jgi:hypothetical protein
MKMKNLNVYSALFVTIGLSLLGCKPKLEGPDPDMGTLDVSKYVAVGSSITAGYADGALYYEAQQFALPNLLAEQFNDIGGIEFKTPFVPQNSNGLSIIPNNSVTVNAKFILALTTDCKGVTSLGPLKLSATESYNFFASNNYNISGPFNNMGVPNTKAKDVLTKGNANPFYQRMASNLTSASILTDAMAQNPTFFSLLIGSDDVMAYALAGGSADVITPSSVFNLTIDTIVNELTKNGAKGVIGNIPDLMDLPFFTTIPYNGLTLTQALADQLNPLYAPLGISFVVGDNAFIVADSTSSIGRRQIQEGEYFVLTTPLDSIKCYNWGSLTPIPERDYLKKADVDAIQDAIANYNIKLRAVAQAKGLAFVDVNAFYKRIKTGIVYNGIAINAEFVKGGMFSLDGLQLNPLGNAMLANEFIKAINQTYSSTISQLDVTKYRGVVFP